MSNQIDELPINFRESLIENYHKNIKYTINKLYNTNYDDKTKIKILNKLVDRINGYEGEIILKYNKYVLMLLANNLNNFSKICENESLKREIEQNINFLIYKINIY